MFGANAKVSNAAEELAKEASSRAEILAREAQAVASNTFEEASTVASAKFASLAQEVQVCRTTIHERRLCPTTPRADAKVVPRAGKECDLATAGACVEQDKGLQEVLYEKTRGASEAAASLAATLKAQLEQSGTEEVRPRAAWSMSAHPLCMCPCVAMRERSS